MKIALIFPSYKHKFFSENLRVVDEEFCYAPPIILAYVASILKRAGHKVILIDTRILGLSKEKTLSILRDFRPHFLAFRLETYHFHDTLDWIRFLKSKLNIPVVAGGINLTLYPKESLSYSEIDYGIIGDAIETLPKLLHSLENEEDIRGIEGLAYREDGKVKINSPSVRIVNFNDYPFPARDLLPNEKYHSFLSKRKNFTIMVTSRGCPYNCNFCAISKILYQERSPQNVVNEIEECYREYNVREIDFFDATFFLNKNRFLEICNEIQRRKIKIEWSCRTRVDLVDDEILKKAASAGCRQILFGIESANEQILKNIRKGIDHQQTRWTIKLCKKYGIRTMGFFMIGNPGETRQSIEETIKFSKQLKLDFAQFCRTIAKPHTDLDQILKEKTGQDYWSEYILSGTDRKRLRTPWTDLSEEEIEGYAKKAYYSFYFRPIQVLMTIYRVKSIEELLKYIWVGVKMLFCNKEEG